jgi:hypothetical protein
MLSIFLIEELGRITQQMEYAELLFYFCSHQDEKRNTAVAVLRGLVYQIVAKRPKLTKYVLPYFETLEKPQQTLSSLETLWIIFRMLVQDVDLGTMFCVLDGLDECDEDTLRILVPNARGHSQIVRPASRDLCCASETFIDRLGNQAYSQADYSKSIRICTFPENS